MAIIVLELALVIYSISIENCGRFLGVPDNFSDFSAKWIFFSHSR